jgi:hypothetical protein
MVAAQSSEIARRVAAATVGGSAVVVPGASGARVIDAISISY